MQCTHHKEAAGFDDAQLTHRHGRHPCTIHGNRCVTFPVSMSSVQHQQARLNRSGLSTEWAWCLDLKNSPCSNKHKSRKRLASSVESEKNMMLQKQDICGGMRSLIMQMVF